MNTSRQSKYLTISATVVLGLVGSVALVFAGPITSPGGSPFTKLAVYQGVIAIVPGLSGDSVMEIGNAGRDIAGSSDLVLRPGTSNSLFVRADSNGGSDRATQLIIQGYTNQNLKLNLGIHTEASPAYAEIGVVEELVDWRNLIFAKSGGNIGIGGVTAPAGKLVVNNNLTGTGSSGDAIAAYADSDNSAVYAQQTGAGWAGYFSGPISVTGGITLNGVHKSQWKIQVCAVNGGVCLGQYLYTTGTGVNDLRYWYNNSSNVPVQGPLVYSSILACPNGYHGTGTGFYTRSTTSGVSYFDNTACSGPEYVLSTSTSAYGTTPDYCIKDTTELLAPQRVRNASGCSTYTLSKNFSSITAPVTVSQPAYELR